MIVNGSFVTEMPAPNDVDIVVLFGDEYPRGEQPIHEVEVRWPFLQVMVAVDDDDLETWAREDFGTDRIRRPKGVTEVML
jgi:hypothetical protein